MSEYTKITYPRKNYIIAHLTRNPEGACDIYAKNPEPPFEVRFDENMTVADIGYVHPAPYQIHCRKGRDELMVFCPHCMRLAQTFTNEPFIYTLCDYDYYKDMDPGFFENACYYDLFTGPEMFECRACGRLICVDSKKSITQHYRPLRNPIKEDSKRWTSALLFDDSESVGRVSVVFNYAVSGVNEDVWKTFTKLGAVRVTMNLRTGMTYALNSRVRGKYPDKSMRFLKGSHVLNITYGSIYLSQISDDEMNIDGTLFDRLNDPEVVKFFSEALIKYKGIKKEILTKTGDFSDTKFNRLKFVNCVPEASMYADTMERLETYLDSASEWISSTPRFLAVKRCLKDIRKTFGKGGEYAVARYMDKKIPKSIRKRISTDLIDFYVYTAVKKLGFRNTDLIRGIMDMDLRAKIKFLSLTENYPSEYGDKKHAAMFMNDMIRRVGEKKAARILKDVLPLSKRRLFISFWTR